MTTPSLQNIGPKPNPQRLVLVPVQVSPNTTFIPSTHLPRLIVRSESSPVVGSSQWHSPSPAPSFQSNKSPHGLSGLIKQSSASNCASNSYFFSPSASSSTSASPFIQPMSPMQWNQQSSSNQKFSIAPPKPPPLPPQSFSTIPQQQPIVHRVQLAPPSPKYRSLDTTACITSLTGSGSSSLSSTTQSFQGSGFPSSSFISLGSPRVAASIRHRRDVLRKKIEQRPSRQNLVTQHILLTASRADPLIQQRAASLRKCGIVSNLNRKLRQRPGPLELITRKILRADAELEQAIQEGRLLFKPTSAEEDELVSSTIEAEFNPINPDMEVVSVSTPKEEIIPSPSFPKIAVLKSKKKATPYQSPTENVMKAKNRSSNVKEHESLVQGDNDGTTNNYQILLKQQQIFLDWQPEIEETNNDPQTILGHKGEQSPLSNNLNSEGVNAIETAIHQAREALPLNQTILIQEASETGNAVEPAVSAATSTTNPGFLIFPPRSLNDLRVQDLKNECKKRALPVSGAKPQLVERLRVHEQVILSSIVNAIEGGPSTPPVSPTDDQNMTTAPHTPMPPGPPVVREQTRETIHDFLQQNAAKIRSANASAAQTQPQSQIVMTIPNQKISQPNLPITQPQQFVKLVDQNGTVLGMATVMNGGGPMNLVGPGSFLKQGSQTMTYDISNGTSRPTNLVGSMIHKPQTTIVTSLPNSNGLSLNTGDPPTFRFAQMGSGGQFTIVQPSDQQGTGTVETVSSTNPPPPATPQQNLQMVPVSNITTQMQPLGNQSIMTGNNGIVSTMTMVGQNGVPMQVVHIAQPQEVVHFEDQQHMRATFQAGNVTQSSQVVQVAYVDGDGIVRRMCPSGSPVVGDAPASSPNMPPPSVNHEGALTPIPPPSALSQSQATNTSHTITIDTNDSSSLATTLQMHEEMLKFQQKKIEEMRAELIRSQQQLRAQQSLIMVAKKQQFGEGGRTAMSDHYLAQLKNAYRSHMHQVMLHKDQEVQLQQHVLEQNSLVAGEAKLQEELHVEQAVNDIVRLIKQDARTALLIVQLLRKYQLERQAELTQQQKAQQEKQKKNEDSPIGAPQSVQPQPLIPSPTNPTKRSKSKAKTQNPAPAPVDRAHSETPQQMNNSSLLVPGNPLSLTQQRRASNPETMRNKEEVVEIHTISDDETVHSVVKPPVSSKSKAKSKKSNNHQNGEHPRPKTQVDMEEIFKTVLKDASRAIGQQISDDSFSDGAATTAYGSPINISQENIALDVACNLSVPQMNAETIVGERNHGVDAQNFIMVHQPCTSDIQMDECSREADTSLHGDRNFQSAILPFHPSLEHNAQTPPCFAKNEDFDDLMDVLRDDQVQSISSNQIMDFGLGYGQEELAKLIGDDWIESAERSLRQENQHHHDQSAQSCAVECLGESGLLGGNGEDTNMDWLDMMLQNAPLDEGTFDGLRTPSFYQRNQMDAPC
ncbi:unnamed protein product, partial [Mesorhabditis belari]|uniref:SAP domain-containing protein n=1 Tax=Mesorhabditis belari TaxID=2138241 RepID=A0AAF3ENW1_9BILA